MIAFLFLGLLLGMLGLVVSLAGLVLGITGKLSRREADRVVAIGQFLNVAGTLIPLIGGYVLLPPLLISPLNLYMGITLWRRGKNDDDFPGIRGYLGSVKEKFRTFAPSPVQVAVA